MSICEWRLFHSELLFEGGKYSRVASNRRNTVDSPNIPEPNFLPIVVMEAHFPRKTLATPLVFVASTACRILRLSNRWTAWNGGMENGMKMVVQHGTQ